jgi:hypothetical protein
MPLMKRILWPLTLTIVSGCVCVKTVSIQMTEPRPAIPIKDVRLVLTAPTNAVLLADIYAEACCSSEQAANAAQADLKKKAAAIGANALVIERWEPTIDYSDVNHHFRIEANAYYTPPPAP